MDQRGAPPLGARVGLGDPTQPDWKLRFIRKCPLRQTPGRNLAGQKTAVFL